MRVGIDARLLSEQVTGIGRYTTELTRHLVAQPGEFCLYSGGDFPSGQWQRENVRQRSCGLRGRVAKMLWSQTALPFWSARDGVDVFWGATHRLPRFVPRKAARVVTIHDLVWKHAGHTMRPLSRWMEQKLMPQAVDLADLIVADSHSTAKDIATEYPAAADKVRVVYPGVTELPAPAALQSLSLLGINGPYLLFVGTLEPRKNLKRLLQAYASLDPDVQGQAKLVIAGGKGWGDVDTAAVVKELGLQRRVIITGYVNDQQLATLYAHALFLAMPSLHEGFGLPLVEAMSFGKPVLTSNCSSMPEVAGAGGLLIDPLDVGSIANGLATFLADEQYLLAIAAKAGVNAERFNWGRAAQEMYSVFEDAVRVREASQRGLNH